MRLSALLSSLVLVGVMSVGASIAPAAVTSNAKVATPTVYPCPPTMCY